METIVDLNNFAVACIYADKFSEAIDNLVEALHITRNQFNFDLESQNVEERELVSSRSTSTSHVASHEAASQVPLTSLPSHGHIPTTVVTREHGPSRGDSGFTVNQGPFDYCSAIKYQQPFMALQEITPSFYTACNNRSRTTAPLISKSESQANRTIQLSMIVIFNCALCHERLAQATSSCATRTLLHNKAIALYEKVVDLYFDLSDHDTNGDNDMTNSPVVTGSNHLPRRTGFQGAQQVMIVMAAVNNLVQLNLESPQVRNHYSQLMLALFEDVQQTYYTSAELQRQVDSQARVFLSNMVLSWNIGLEIAAAAA